MLLIRIYIHSYRKCIFPRKMFGLYRFVIISLVTEKNMKLNPLRDDTHMTSMTSIAQFSRPPTTLVFHLLDLGRSIPNEPPFLLSALSLQMITNQLKENIIQGWLWHLIRSILPGFPLFFFHLAEANLVPRVILKYYKPLFHFPLTAERCAGVKVELKPHYLLFRGFIFLCVQLSKNIAKCFLVIIIHIFSTHFATNLFYLHILKT